MHNRRTQAERQPLLKAVKEESEGKESTPEIDDSIPSANWVWAKERHGRRFPQTISHRGYKAANPENTMRSFEGAVAAGTHAIETDIHLSRDNVVVLSHDPDLKRCFGIEKTKIIDCEYSYLSTIRTTQAPHCPMPRLLDLLTYLAEPSNSHIWLLLDIKLDNDADAVMRLIASTIASAPSPPATHPWTSRIVMGIWAAKYLPLCSRYVPDFPISHIGFSTVYARQFLAAPNVSFNMLQRVLFGWWGRKFMADVKAAKRPLFVWTVNADNLMRWCVHKEVDGVITDDPKRFNEICRDWEKEGVMEREGKVSQTWRQWGQTLYFWIMIFVFGFGFRRRWPETVEASLRMGEVRRGLRERGSVSESIDR